MTTGVYTVRQFPTCTYVFRDGVEVAQAVTTGHGVYHAVRVNGQWTGYDHESITLDQWTARFTQPTN